MLGTGMKVSLSPYTAHGAPARQASRISLSKACEKLRQKLRSSSNSIHGYGQRRTRCKQHSSPNLRLYSENPQSARRAPRRSSDSDNTQHASAYADMSTTTFQNFLALRAPSSPHSVYCQFH